MKKLLLFTALFCVFLLSGCKDDEEPVPGSLYLYSTSARVDAVAGSHSVTLFSTTAWEADADAWITVDPESVDRKGICAVRLTYGQNTTGDERSGTVLFRTGACTETFTITQKAK